MPATRYIDTPCGEEIVLEDGDRWEDCGCGQGTSCCGDRWCESCHEEDEIDDYESDSELAYYSYTPDPLIFYGGERDKAGLPFYGMEIEVTCSSRSAIRWAKAEFNRRQGGRDNLCYFKSDGSVAGFELVTHPMTYPWALENFPWDLLAVLKEKGCTIRPSDNGIHVHVSRSGFDSDAHAYRWMKLLYRNQEDVTRLARRSSSWARFTQEHRKGQFAHLKAQKGMLSNRIIDRDIRALQTRYYADSEALETNPLYSFRRDSYSYSWTSEQRQLSEAFDRESRRLSQEYSRASSALMRRRVEDTTRSDRYSAVNTGNDGTFEVRLFASTLDPVTAQSTIGLCSASVEYTRHLSAPQCIKEDALSWGKFSEWLETQPLYSAVKYANEKCTAGTRARSTI